MHAAGAEHSRLLARRDAEIESVIAVEARLLAVREEQQRLTRTVLDLRARIERLRAEGAEESENARVGEAGGDASSYAAARSGSSADEAAENGEGSADGDTAPCAASASAARGPTWV